MSFVRMRRMQKYAWDWSILNANENVKLNGDCDVANCTHTQSLRHIHTSVLRRSNSISPMAEAINVIAIRTLLFGLSTVHLAISGFDVNEIYCDESQRTQLTKAFPPMTTTHTSTLPHFISLTFPQWRVAIIQWSYSGCQMPSSIAHQSHGIFRIRSIAIRSIRCDAIEFMVQKRRW